MPWGQQEQQAREAAAALFKLVGAVEKDLARLQEQQRTDDGRYQELRRDVAELRSKLQELEIRYKDFEELLGRIQQLETAASVIGADLSDLVKDFDSYRVDLEKKANQLRADIAVAEAEKVKKTRRQLGFILGGLGVAIAPKLWDLVNWILEQISLRQ